MEQSTSSPTASFAARALRAVALVGAMLLAIAGIVALPMLRDTPDRGHQKRSIAGIFTLSQALERYAAAQGEYPRATSIEELRAALEPEFATFVPLEDGWGRPFVVRCAPSGCEIRSLGSDGIAGDAPGFAADIVHADGRFLQPADLGL